MNTTPEKSTIGSKLTCISCRLLFQAHEEQKEHYHTDFHRYNLKRKIASLPPLTFEAYIQKIEGFFFFYNHHFHTKNFVIK